MLLSFTFINYYTLAFYFFSSQTILTVQEIEITVHAAKQTSKRHGVAHLPVTMLQPLSLLDQLLSMGFLSVQITVLSFVTDEMSFSVVTVMEMQQQVQQQQPHLQQLLQQQLLLLLPLLPTTSPFSFLFSINSKSKS